MRRAAQNALLGAYRLIFAKRLLRLGWGRRLYFALYDFYKNLLEAGRIGQLRRFVPEDGFVIDVGANIGFFTLRFARWVGEKGRVLAIEPEPDNHAALGARLAARELAGRVAAIRAAADAASGTAHLVINPGHPGDHRLGEGGVAVPAVALDAIVSPGRRVSLIKIDVQGAEMRVLQGADAILARDKPALFVEVHPVNLARFGASVDALLDALASRRYQAHRLGRAGPRPCSRGELGSALARHGYVDLLFLAE